MASASTSSANEQAKDIFLVHIVQLKPMMKAHTYIYTLTPTRLHYPARLHARVKTMFTIAHIILGEAIPWFFIEYYLKRHEKSEARNYINEKKCRFCLLLTNSRKQGMLLATLSQKQTRRSVEHGTRALTALG